TSVGGPGTNPVVGGVVIENPGNTLPPIPKTFALVGYTRAGSSYAASGIATDTILRVKMKSAPGDPMQIPNSPLTANYNCVTFHVSVTDDITGTIIAEKTTAIMSVAGHDTYFCRGAPTEDTLDFSTALAPGHGSLTITVSKPATDFFCYYQAAVF